MFYGFDGAFADHRSELLHQLLDQRVRMNRLFSGALSLGATTLRGLRRRFLLGFCSTISSCNVRPWY